MIGDVEYKVMLKTDYAKLVKQIKDENYHFSKAQKMAEVEWNKQEDAGRYSGRGLSKRKIIKLKSYSTMETAEQGRSKIIESQKNSEDRRKQQDSRRQRSNRRNNSRNNGRNYNINSRGHNKSIASKKERNSQLLKAQKIVKAQFMILMEPEPAEEGADVKKKKAIFY